MQSKEGDIGGPLGVERFCSRCGVVMSRRVDGGRERPWCPECGHIVFGRFSVGVGGLLVHEAKVLMVQRAHDPGKGRWTLPGGYVEEDESPDTAIVREVVEETGILATVGGLLTIRHAQTIDHQNAYYVFRLSMACAAEDLRAAGDGYEVSRAVFIAPSDLGALGEIGMISRWVVERYTQGGAGMSLVPADALPPPVPNHRWTAVYASRCRA